MQRLFLKFVLVCGFSWGNVLVAKTGENLPDLVQETQYATDLGVLSGALPDPHAMWKSPIEDRHSEDNLKRVRKFLINALMQAGYNKVHYEKFEFGREADGMNLFVEIPGSESADEIVVIGAHYDTTGYGMPGANDNATGVTAVLNLARGFIASGLKPKRTLRFVFWDGEEKGYIGSDAHFERMAMEQQDIIGVFNFDMIGFAPVTTRHAIFDTHGNKKLRQFIEATNKGMENKFALEHWSPFRSDSAAAAEYGFAAVSFSEDPKDPDGEDSGLYPYMHDSEDTLDKINTDYATQLTNFVSQVAWKAAQSSVRFGDKKRGAFKGSSAEWFKAIKVKIGVLKIGGCERSMM